MRVIYDEQIFNQNKFKNKSKNLNKVLEKIPKVRFKKIKIKRHLFETQKSIIYWTRMMR